MNAEHVPDPTALWLCQLPGMTAALLRELLAAFGSADAVLRASSSALRRLGVAPALVAQLVAGPRQIPHVAAGLKGLQRLGIVPLPFAAPSYPERLQRLSEPPLVVYVQGPWPLAQPLALIVQPDEIDPRVATGWEQISATLRVHAGFAALATAAAAQTRPALLGVHHGLMLARQRLPQDLWKQVTARSCTLLSICPPTAQPDPALAHATYRALAALSDALVALLPLPAEADDLLTTARAVGLPMFGLGATTRTPLPPAMRRLRPGKSGVRALSIALGVHPDGTSTIQQERLF
ncbi:MAG TPA: hypothetical protein VFZ66_15890 [Herpetosiphonaceae bacterium]